MATRSTIALEFADGTVQSVYCHWDGYLQHNGSILLKHYMDPFKVRELMDLGQISVLGSEIGVKRPFENPYTYNSAEWREFNDTYQNQCTFYGRDRGETDVGPMKFANFSEYVRNNDSQEYNYILRQIKGKAVWFVESDTTGGYVTLEDAFAMTEESVE